MHVLDNPQWSLVPLVPKKAGDGLVQITIGVKETAAIGPIPGTSAKSVPDSLK